VFATGDAPLLFVAMGVGRTCSYAPRPERSELTGLGERHRVMVDVVAGAKRVGVAAKSA
jgi:hypothetical protein